MPEEIVAQFDKCPVCKLREELAKILGKPELAIGDGAGRFVEELSNEVKSKGWMRPELNFYAQMLRGIVRDGSPEIEAKIPIGSTIPTYNICFDVCADCGCLYAVKLVRGEAKKTLPPTSQMQIPPGSLNIKRN